MSEIGSFLKLSEKEKIDKIVLCLKQDKTHEFSAYKQYTIIDIAKSTLKAIEQFSYYTENNPIGILEDTYLKVCFQPDYYNPDNVDKIIIYFGHIVTGDSSNKRIFSRTKNQAIDHLMLVIQNPEKIHEQLTTPNKSFLFERKIQINKIQETCCIVLYVERIRKDLLRVVTILPDQKITRLERKKETNLITELASFSELHDAISPSVVGEVGNSGELYTNINDTNINNNVNKTNNLENNNNQSPEILELGGPINHKMTKQIEALQETIGKLKRGIASAGTPDAQKKMMQSALDTKESELATLKEKASSVPASKIEAPKKVVAVKKAAPKKAAPKKTTKSDESDTFTVDGVEYNKADCHDAMRAWDARHKQSKEANHEYQTKPVVEKVASNLATAVKQAVGGVTKNRMENNPGEVLEGAKMIEKGVEQLFNGFEKLTGKKVSETKRKEVLAILLDTKEEAEENR